MVVNKLRSSCPRNALMLHCWTSIAGYFSNIQVCCRCVVPYVQAPVYVNDFGMCSHLGNAAEVSYPVWSNVIPAQKTPENTRLTIRKSFLPSALPTVIDLHLGSDRSRIAILSYVRRTLLPHPPESPARSTLRPQLKHETTINESENSSCRDQYMAFIRTMPSWSALK